MAGEGKKAKKRDKPSVAAHIIGVLVSVVILYKCTSSSSNGAYSRKTEAWTYCQMLVEHSLKAPGTASFPGRIQVSIVGDEFIVNSYVDAQNSFGAMLRANYTCTLTHNDGTNGWTVQDFHIFQ